MSTVSKADPAIPAGSAPHLSERRPLGDRTFQVITLVAGLLVLVILVLIAISTSQQASSWFSSQGLKILSNNWNPAANQFVKQATSNILRAFADGPAAARYPAVDNLDAMDEYAGDPIAAQHNLW